MQKKVKTRWEHLKNELRDSKVGSWYRKRGNGDLSEEAYFWSYATTSRISNISIERKY
jgi:hypothetical protein